MNASGKNEIIIDILSKEGVKTSEIEGEFLNRASVQSSIRKKLGLSTKIANISQKESGIAELMIEIYTHFSSSLNQADLHNWNKKILKGRLDLKNIGKYRTHKEPMQIISGVIGSEKVHFEAPPSQDVCGYMEKFIQWYNDSLWFFLDYRVKCNA